MDSNKPVKKQSEAMSFYHAWEGIVKGILGERHMKVHLFALLLVCLCGWFFHLAPWEWVAVLVVSSLVITSELMNTAIEATVDMAMPQHHPLAKKAKDTAAGAVLVSAIFAVVVGVIVFLPKIISLG